MLEEIQLYDYIVLVEVVIHVSALLCDDAVDDVDVDVDEMLNKGK